jgi:hypothetical protein
MFIISAKNELEQNKEFLSKYKKTFCLENADWVYPTFRLSRSRL